MKRFYYFLFCFAIAILTAIKVNAQQDNTMISADSSYVLSDTVLSQTEREHRFDIYWQSESERDAFKSLWKQLSRDLAKRNFKQLKQLLLDSVYICGNFISKTQVSDGCLSDIFDTKVSAIISDTAHQIYFSPELVITDFNERSGFEKTKKGKYKIVEVQVRQRLGCWYCEIFEVDFVLTNRGYKIRGLDWQGRDCCH